MERKFYLKINKVSNDLKGLDNQVVRSDDPLPKQDIVWIINGGKGSGKSTMALNVLKSKNGYKKWFDNIFLVSPTAQRDPKFNKLCEELDRDGKCYSTCDDETIDAIISKLMEFNDGFDSSKEERRPHSLVIFDDCLAFLPKSTQKSSFNRLITTSRHLNTSVWILTQKYNKVNPLIRANMDLLSFFRTNNKLEFKTLEDDVNVDEQELKTIYDFATEQPNSFLHISFFGGKPNFFKKFDKIILE
jgi:hypothetical protein